MKKSFSEKNFIRFLISGAPKGEAKGAIAPRPWAGVYVRIFSIFFSHIWGGFGEVWKVKKFVKKIWRDHSLEPLAGFFIKKLVLPLDIICIFFQTPKEGCNMVKKIKTTERRFFDVFFAIFTPFKANILKKILILQNSFWNEP